MGDITRALSGLEDFEVTGPVECGGGLMVSVRLARPNAASPLCGTFSSRVKEYRSQRVRDGLSYERPTVLVWTKRRFRCETPGCVGTFTASTVQVPSRRRVTARLCRAITRAAWDRSTVAVARTFKVAGPRRGGRSPPLNATRSPSCPPVRCGAWASTRRPFGATAAS